VRTLIAPRVTVTAMPHAARIWPESNLHLVTTGGNGRCRIFLDFADRDSFLDLFDAVVALQKWDLYAWCLLATTCISSLEPPQRLSTAACIVSRACMRCVSTGAT
jgi:hypothetical protein